MDKKVLFFCGVVVFESKEQGIYIMDKDDLVPGTLCNLEIYRTCCNGDLLRILEHLDLIVQEERRKQFLTQIISIGYMITQERIKSDEIYAYKSISLLTSQQLQKELDAEDRSLIKKLIRYFSLREVGDVLLGLQTVGEKLMKATYNTTKQHQYN